MSRHRLSALFAITLTLLAVAAAHAAPLGRYTVNGNGTVTDNRTRLTWQQSTAFQATGVVYTHSGAVDYCSSLALAGGGWRMPNIKEVLSLVDDTQVNPPIDLRAFPGTPGVTNTPGAGFWSSTASMGTSDVCPTAGSCYWIVAFSVGGHFFFPPSNSFNVRCVR